METRRKLMIFLISAFFIKYKHHYQQQRQQQQEAKKKKKKFLAVYFHAINAVQNSPVEMYFSIIYLVSISIKNWRISLKKMSRKKISYAKYVKEVMRRAVIYVVINVTNVIRLLRLFVHFVIRHLNTIMYSIDTWLPFTPIS